MKRIYLVLPLLAILITGVVFATREFVSAQSAGQGLEISPPSQEVTVDPGGTTTIRAKITNKSNTTLPIDVKIEDFTAKGEEGQIEFSANSPYSIASWTKVSPANFDLGPQETQEVIATVNAPSDAAGGRFGSFVFAVRPETPQPGTATVSQQVASLFLVKVSGPVDEKLSIKAINAPLFSEFGPISIDVTYHNDGNVHVKPYGLVNVTDMFGKKVADIPVPGANVFPNADRVIKSQLDKQILFGKYTATALMYYGSGNDSLTATTTFYVFPVRIIAGVLVLLFILFFLRKRFKKAGKAYRR